MIETLTLIDGRRIAQAFDYPDNKTDRGETFRAGPAKIGGQPIAVSFDVHGSDVVLTRVFDMHTMTPVLPSLAVTELLQSHCERYLATHPALKQRAEAT